MAILLDSAQRFSCHQCGRCCRHGWAIPILPSEVERYRAEGAERWYRESVDGPEGAQRDPFERVRGGAGLFRMRKRRDGACGFLSAEGRCRIHEELGERRKPLACRAFPFQFHGNGAQTIVATSFSCPTVVLNEGLEIAGQRKSLERLAQDWLRAFPGRPKPLELVAGRPIDEQVVALLRETLLAILSRPGEDLPSALGRIADLLDDLSRPRVGRLSSSAFADYLAVTGRFAAESEKPPEPRPPTRLSRLFFRGYLFASGAIQMRLEAHRLRQARLQLWGRQLWLLLHVHGVAPSPPGMNLGAARRRPLPPKESAVWPIARHYCRGALASLGSGRWPLVTEVGVAMASLRVAFIFAALRAGESAVDEEDFVHGLTEAADVFHADTGALGRSLGLLSGGTESLRFLAAGR